MPQEPRTREADELTFGRIVAFSDGVFAIAITLLVLQLAVPGGADSSADLWHRIGDQSSDLIAYGISFAVIGRFWLSHHRLFSGVRSFDSGLLWLNLLYLAFIVLIPFSSQLLGEYSYYPAVMIYAFNLALVTFTGAMMCQYLLKSDLAVAGDKDDLRGDGRDGGLFATGVFLVSIPVALLSTFVAQLLWIALITRPEKLRGLRRKSG